MFSEFFYMYESCVTSLSCIYRVREDFLCFLVLSRSRCYVYALDVGSIQAYSLDVGVMYKIGCTWRNMHSWWFSLEIFLQWSIFPLLNC